MRKFILTAIVLIASIVGANAQEKETITSINLHYLSFDGFQNYGLVDYFINPNGFGGEFGLRANLEKHGNYNMDLGVNYAYELTNKNDLTALLVMSLGPSLRMQDQVKGIKNGTVEYEQKFKFDGFINPRLTVKYKSVMASVGYFYWVPEFKFSKSDGATGGLNVSLGYSF